MSQEIFISYRRKDTGGYAGRLYDYLKKEFGPGNVLFDVEATATVEELRIWVERVVPYSSVVLVLMGEQWIEDVLKRRRLEDDGDIVRFEIELALNNQIPIIPIFVDGVNMPLISDLPASIQRVASYKGYEINNSFWESKFQTIVHAISSVLKTHSPIIKRGVKVWNTWRESNPNVKPNLRGANLEGINLESINLSFTDLTGVDLSGAILRKAMLRSADFTDASLKNANFEDVVATDAIFKGAELTSAVFAKSILDAADFSGAALQYANLESVKADSAKFINANLSKVNFTNANLKKANFTYANLNEANLEGAFLQYCQIYGVSVWNTALKNARQTNLYLGDPLTGNKISIDNIEMAVLINLFSSGEGIRNMIDTVSTKSILILGNFRKQNKIVLDQLKDEFLKRNYIPILFDFEKPSTRDMTETIHLLAAMSRFIIADFTDSKSIVLEIHSFLANLPSVPVVPIFKTSSLPPTLLSQFSKYSWVMTPVAYNDTKDLLLGIDNAIIAPAEMKIAEMKNKTGPI